jgi:hypothetical protein
MPPATAVMPVMLLTWTGLVFWIVVLSPSWPLLFRPQAYALPPVTARLWLVPAPMVVTLVSVLTWTGLVCVVVDPIPSWPLPLTPTAKTRPSLRSARVWRSPPAIAVMDVRELPATG